MNTSNHLLARLSDNHDVVFFYRTSKKKRYFNLLKQHSLNSLNCKVQAYHTLPSAPLLELASEVLEKIVLKAELELYNAKGDTWQSVKVLLRPILVAQIKRLYTRLYHYLVQNKPKVVVIWNGHKWQDNVLHAVNQHFAIPLTYFENGVLPHSTTMDFCGINALNSVPREARFFASYIHQQERPKMNIKGRKYKQRKSNKIAFARPNTYILVPFQKDRDSQILDNSLWIKSMTQLFSIVLKAVEQSQRDDLHIIFREHPSAKTQYSSLYTLAANHPRVCFDQQSELSEIICHAEAVITINSTVGLESLLLGTKVITLGEAFYNIDTLVLTAASTSELTAHINALEQFSPNQLLRNAFMNYLHHEYVIPGDWKAPETVHYQAIQERMLNFLNGLPPIEQANMPSLPPT